MAGNGAPKTMQNSDREREKATGRERKIWRQRKRPIKRETDLEIERQTDRTIYKSAVDVHAYKSPARGIRAFLYC